MASKLLRIHHQTIKISDSKFHFLKPKTLPESRISFLSLSLKCSLSSTNPPTTKKEAINQVKISLSATLEKPLNNPRLAGKIKNLNQPRFRVEFPVADDSPDSLTQLALEVFGEMPIRRNGSKTKILIIWPTQSLTQAAAVAFESRSSNLVTENVHISSVFKEDTRILNSADVAVFLSPESSQLSIMKTVTDSIYPKPVIIFNPTWGFEEESDFGELSGFLGTFEVVYSFVGLEVQGVLSKRKGMIFKCVKDGILSGDKWNMFVEEEGKLKLVSTFKVRPSIVEVENVLYNLMGINSPIAKSAKFLKNLVSNVTGKK